MALPAWRALVAVSSVVQAHSVRMGFLPCAGCGPGRRGGAVAGGWSVVQAHSVRMALLPCPCADGGCLVVRPIRCAWGSFLVLVVALAGVAGPLRVGGRWFRPIRCAWRSFLVLVLMADAWWSGPFGAHGVPSLCWLWPWPAWRGRCGWVVGGSGPFGAHGVPSLCWLWPWPAWRGRCGWVVGGSGPFGAHGAPSLSLADGGCLVVRPIRCAWGSFLVLLGALAGVAGPLRVGGWSLGPLGAHVRLLAAQRPAEGACGGTI